MGTLKPWSGSGSPGTDRVMPRWGILLGNAFEHYDTALFGLLSPFLAPLFFTDYSPLMALLLTYAVLPLGMLARPMGSLFFGCIGDREGREKALILALTGMAFITALMGLIPTYREIGASAPLFLVLGRLLQNFFAAGEAVGGAIYLMEQTDNSEHGFISGIYGASTMAGFLLASLGVSLFCAMGWIEDCWRLLYFFGCATALVAVAMRTGCSASAFVFFRPSAYLGLLHDAKRFFTASIPGSTQVGFFPSLGEMLLLCWRERRVVMTIAVAAGFSYASYAVALVMMNGLVPLVTSFSKTEMAHLNTVLLGVDLLLLPCFGILANRYSREKTMGLAGLAAALGGLPIFWCLQGASLGGVILIRLALVVIGVWFSAPFYAWTQHLVPRSERYTLISLAYALGSQLIGAPAAALSLWFFHVTGSVMSAALYWVSLGLLSSYLLRVRESAVIAPRSRVMEG